MRNAPTKKNKESKIDHGLPLPSFTNLEVHWCQDSSALRAKVCYSLPSRRPQEESPERSRRRLEWRYPRCSTSGKSPDRYRADGMMLDVFGLHNKMPQIVYTQVWSMNDEKCIQMLIDSHWSTLVCILDSAENFSHINCQPSNKSYSNWPMRTDATGSRQRHMQIMTTMRFQYSGPSNKFRTSWLMHFNKIGMTKVCSRFLYKNTSSIKF